MQSIWLPHSFSICCNIIFSGLFLNFIYCGVQLNPTQLLRHNTTMNLGLCYEPQLLLDVPNLVLTDRRECFWSRLTIPICSFIAAPPFPPPYQFVPSPYDLLHLIFVCWKQTSAVSFHLNIFISISSHFLGGEVPRQSLVIQCAMALRCRHKQHEHRARSKRRSSIRASVSLGTSAHIKRDQS